VDIAAMSIALSHSNVQQQVSVAVTKMAMGAIATQGNLIVALASATTKAMESSVQPNLGANLDIQA